MVNKIPAYMISSGGTFAILASRSHPSSMLIMAEACKYTLESCGVDKQDIYIIDCPSDILLPGLSRETAKTGFFSAIIALAALPADSRMESALTAAMAGSDFDAPVVPVLVPCTAGDTTLARMSEEAGRAALELTNLNTLLEELTIAASVDVLDELSAEMQPRTSATSGAAKNSGSGNQKTRATNGGSESKSTKRGAGARSAASTRRSKKK